MEKFQNADFIHENFIILSGYCEIVLDFQNKRYDIKKYNFLKDRFHHLKISLIIFL